MSALDSESQQNCMLPNRADKLVWANWAFKKAIRANEVRTSSKIVNKFGTGVELVQSHICSKEYQQ